MWGELDRFSRVLADAALAETVFLSLVVVVMLLCRQPARRIIVAKAAVLLSIVMIPLVAYSPFPRVQPRSWFAASSPAALTLGEKPSTASAGIPSQGAETEWWTHAGFGRVLTVTYLAGVSVGLLWFLLGFWMLAWLVNGSSEPSLSTQALYQTLAAQVGGFHRAPCLLVSARVRQPLQAGVFQPFILIPSEYDGDRTDAESSRVILTHELVHARERDSRLGALASLAQSLWFFIPFLWWLRVRLRADQEFLADQRAARAAGSSTGYATRLVRLAAPDDRADPPGPIFQPVPAVSGAERIRDLKSQLLQRVVMLLHCPFQIELRPPASWSLTASLLVMVLAGICSGLTLSTSGRPAVAAAIPPSGANQTNQFQVAEFLASPQVMSRTGQSIPYTLPLPLPDAWSLDVEIRATRSALRHIRLAGISIDGSTMAGHSSEEVQGTEDSISSWHRIQLRHDPRHTSLSIDGRTYSLGPGAEPPLKWFTIEPAPDAEVVLRNLTVSW